MKTNIITFDQVWKTQLDQFKDMVNRPDIILRTINSLGISYNNLRFINFDKWGAKDVLDHLCYIIYHEHQWVYDNLMILGLDFMEMPGGNSDNLLSLLIIQRWLCKYDISEEMKGKLEEESHFFNYGGIDFQSTVLWDGNLITIYTLIQR